MKFGLEGLRHTPEILVVFLKSYNKYVLKVWKWSDSKIMTPSFYYCYVIWVPNGNEFSEGEGSPELKYDSSKKKYFRIIKRFY